MLTTVALPVGPASSTPSRNGQNVDESSVAPCVTFVICVGSNLYWRTALKPCFLERVLPAEISRTNRRPANALGLSYNSSSSIDKKVRNSQVSTARSRL